MKKKKYEQPEMQVVKLEQADIICTSGGFNDGDLKINNGEDLIFEEVDTW